MELEELVKTQSRLAAEALDRAAKAPWQEVIREADQAERIVVRLRNRLIDEIRQEDARDWRLPLQRLNLSLSLIAGIEYPSSGIRRNVIEQARDVLKGMSKQG